MAEVILTINGRKIENTFTKLRTETRALERELRNLTPGTEAFTKKAQEVKNAHTAFNKVNKEIVRMRKEIDKTGNFFTRFINKIGGWQNILTGIFSSGALFSTKATVDELLKISDAITDVQKTSGLSKKAVGELWHELSDLDTRTSKLDLMNIAEIGGRLGIQDKDELKTFTEEIDKAYVALGDSFGGGLEAVTTKLGKMKNLFAETKNLDYGTAINQIGSALNELAAQGTASEENISDFAMRVGQLPEALKPAGDKILGLGAAFEESGLTAEIASSGYSGFMLSAANNIDAFAKSMGMGLTEAKKLLNEKPEEFFIRFAQGMKGLDATQTAKIFKDLKLNTQEITKAVGAAAQNSGRFYEMMSLSGKAMDEATSLANEAHNKNTNSAAIWEKIFKTIKNVITDGAIPEMFDRISEFFGKITGITSESGDGVKKFTATIVSAGNTLLFFIKTLIVAKATFVSYRIAVLLASKSTKSLIQQTILYNTVEKISTALKKTATTVTLLYSIAKYKLTGNTKRAAAAMRMFNMVTKMNPLGLLFTIITAVSVAMITFSKSTKQANFETKALVDAEKEASIQTAKTKHELEQLLKVAKDETKTKKERQEAVDELNRTVPEYNKQLTIESAKYQDASNKLDAYIERLKSAAREKYLKSLVDKKAEEIAALENSSLEDNIKWYEKLASGIHALMSEEKYRDLNTAIANHNRTQQLKKEEEALKKLTELYSKAKTENQSNGNNQPKEGDIKEVNGISFVFRGGKWVRLHFNTSNDDEDKKTKSIKNKAIAEQEKVNKKFLELERQLQDKKMLIKKDGLEKEIELLSIEYQRKKEKIAQESTTIGEQIRQTNTKMTALREQKASSKSPKQKEDINKALKTYDAIQKKRIAILKKNNDIIVQLESTKQFKLATLKEKAFTKDLQRQAKDIEKGKQRRIDEINNITSLEEAKKQLSATHSEAELAKIKTIGEAKNRLREQTNKKALEIQIAFLESQQRLLEQELKTLSGPAAEELKKNLEILTEKVTHLKGVLQTKTDEENTGTTEGTDLGEAGSVDILGFSAQQWVTTFENLDTTEGKLKAVRMAMQALSNVGQMFFESQKRANEKELNDFTNYQKQRKKQLKKQLNAGVISKKKYHKEVEKMEHEAANKKAELEYKQAKADKVARLFAAMTNTAVAITQALTAGAFIGPILAGIVGSIGAIQIAMIRSEPLPPKTAYAQGGFTTGLGFKDQTNHEVAGVVHADEYVIPKWLLEQPQVANVVRWIEAKRTKTTTVFNKGGYTSENENITYDKKNEDYTTTSTGDIQLILTINRLNDILEKLEQNGLDAFLLADAKNGKKMHQAIKQYQQINNKNKR